MTAAAVTSEPVRSTGLRRGGTMRTIWRLAGAKRRVLAFGFACRFLQALFTSIPFALLVSVVDGLRTDTFGDDDLKVVIALYVPCLVGQLVFGWLANRYTAITAYELVGELRARALDHLRRLPLGYHSGRQAGDAVTMMTADMQALESFIASGMSLLVSAAVSPVLVVVVLAFVDGVMALATVVSVVVAVPVYLWSSRSFTRLAGRRQDMQAEASSRILEYVQGIAVIRSFNQAGERLERFRTALDDFRRTNTTLAVKLIPLISVFMTVVELGVPVVIGVGAYRLFGGALDAGSLLVFLILTLRVYQPLLTMAPQSEVLRITDASLARIARVMDEPVRAEPPSRPAPAAFDLSFEHVSFGYHDSPVLHDVSFAVPAGSMTAVVGPSGAGKSTLLHLAARSWDPTSGRVCLGGVDLQDLSTEQVFDSVTAVFQDVVLFSGTIRENIAFGRPEASDAEVAAAAQAAQAAEFIEALPDGYATVLSEGGATLSGGERQRLTIARAILKDAPVVLLDEATAALDPTSERQLQQALVALVAGKTLVVVAHRLSTIRSADQIVAVDGGRVVESGTHHDLLAHDGLYARFWAERERAAAWQIRSQPLRGASGASSASGVADQGAEV